MNKYMQRLFLFETFEIQTKLSKKEIMTKVKSFANPEYTDYFGSVSNDGFLVAQKYTKYFSGGSARNSFAPIAKAKICEKDGIATVKVILRPRALVIILFAPIYILTLITILIFPLTLLLMHFAFVKPAQKLKTSLENLLLEK
ncbi:MAG: hypothetical protein E7667_03905 [Ruminococcaceae bacterium]|nr:hypothetical protein [Oscillospiraceae bacterium]